MEMALNEVEKGMNVRGAAGKYAIPECSIKPRHLKLLTAKSSRKLKKDREPELGMVTEKRLANCIRVLCRNGLSPTKEDIVDLGS